MLGKTMLFFYTGLRETLGYASWTSFFFCFILAFLKRWAVASWTSVFFWGGGFHSLVVRA